VFDGFIGLVLLVIKDNKDTYIVVFDGFIGLVLPVIKIIRAPTLLCLTVL